MKIYEKNLDLLIMKFLGINAFEITIRLGKQFVRKTQHER